MPFRHDVGEPCLAEPVADRLDLGQPSGIGCGHPGDIAFGNSVRDISWRDRSDEHPTTVTKDTQRFGDSGTRLVS
jgi:hypothetical protein